MSEKLHVEDPTVRMSLKYGIKHRKMNGLGNRDWPDQFFYSRRFRKGVKGVFIEFKDKNKKPTKKQFIKMKELKGAGFDVAWFDNKVDAIEYLLSFLKPKYRTLKG